MPLSRPRTALVRAAALLSLVACTSGGEGTTGPAAPTLTLSATSAAPATIVSGQLSGRTLPAGTVTATFNALVVPVTRLDDSSFAFAVPVVTPGAYPLVVTHLNGTLTGTLQVTAAPVIANPGAYVTSAIDIGEDALDALELELNAGVDDLAADSTLRREDIARIRVLIADARAKAAVATPAERAQAAAYLAANAGALGITVSGSAFREKSGIVSTMQAELGTGSCIDENGVELTDAEECSAQLTIFGNDAVKRLLVLAASTAIAYVEGATFVGAVAAVVTAVLVYKELARIQDETMRRFIAPVIARLSIFGDEELKGSDALLTGGATTAVVEPEYFVTATTRAFRVRGEYRSLRASDVSIGGLAPLVSVARTIERITNGIRAALLQRVIRPIVPETPRRVFMADIPQRYLRLGEVAPSAINGVASTSEASWMLRFTRSGITADIPFTFDVRYAAPGQAVQESTVGGVLIATPRFIARSLSDGSNGAGMCAEDVNGVSYCWGFNIYGRLGDLTTTNRSRPTRLVTGADLRGLSMGDDHTCGLTDTGLAECWGASFAIGDPEAARTYNDRNTAGPVEGGWTYQKLVAGGSSTCGMTGGSILCWGPLNNKFSVPQGTTAPGFGDAVAMPGGSGLTSVSLGASSFACGVTAAGGLRCIGQNNEGQLGDGTLTDRNVLVTVGGGLTWSAVAAGGNHSCALTTAGRAYCWGQNSQGQVGDGFASAGNGPTRSPVPVSSSLVFTKIFAGGEASCALTATGKAYCWGKDWGALGTGTLALSNVPAPVLTPVLFKTLSMGRNVACGIATVGGGVYCWGYNTDGAVGTGVFSYNEAVSTVVPPLP